MSGEELKDYQLDGEFKNWPRRPDLMTANALYLFAAMGNMLLVAARALFSCAGMLSAPLNAALGCVYEAGVLALLPLTVVANRPGVERAFRLNPPKASAVGIACALALAAVPLMSDLTTLYRMAIQALGGRISSLSAGVQWENLPWMLVFSAAIPAICEEIMFRGALMGAWERRGTRYALLVSSAMFAALHGSIEGLPAHFLMGLVCGTLAINADSLYCAIAFHMTYNGATLLLSTKQLTESEIELAARSLYAYLGGTAGVLLVLLRMGIALVIFAVLMLAASSDREKQQRPFEREGKVDRKKLGWRELVVLLSAVVTVIGLYALDLCGIVGLM